MTLQHVAEGNRFLQGWALRQAYYSTGTASSTVANCNAPWGAS
jgi:hypothetical protein